MRSFFMMLLLIGAVWTVQGRVVDKMETDDDYIYDVPADGELYDDREYADDDGDNDDDYAQYYVDDDQDLEANYSDIYDDYVRGDDYEYEAEDESTDLATTEDYDDLDLSTGVDLADLKAVIQEYVDQNLGRCKRGVCSFCLKVWKLRLCAVARLSKSGISFSIKMGRRTLFSHSFGVKRRISFTISKGRFPKWARWAMKSGLTITVSRIDVVRRKFCVGLKVKVRFAGTVRYRKCF